MMSNKTGMKILIVDDDPFSIKLLAHMLGQHGHHSVETCDSATAALTLIDSESTAPDLIFLDLNMPAMDGLALIRKLGERRYPGALVLVSGLGKRILDSSRELSRSYHVNILGCIEKPVDPARLSAMLSSIRAPGATPAKRELHFSIEEVLHALEKGELVNFYQPKISLTDGGVKGVEALIRWQHPKYGLVFPDSFIPLVEHHGYINALTRVVVENVLADSRHWLGQNKELPVSVNVSMLSLASFAFMDELCHLIDRNGMTPGDFLFEITESRVLQDPRKPLEILTRLKLRGFGLAIDDFGSSYSNLSKLRDYPFDELKIDRAFIHGVSRDERVCNFYRACLSLAKGYGMTVVAEGVEHEKDRHFLKETGCDLAQGYLIARPMAAINLAAWLAERVS